MCFTAATITSIAIIRNIFIPPNYPCSYVSTELPADDKLDDGSDEYRLKVGARPPGSRKRVIDGRALNGSQGAEQTEIDYDSYPQESQDLDDFEFKNYSLLRKWRLDLCRELDTEPYKIFQNRTLCEIIRRRRNDPDWARSLASEEEQVGEEDEEGAKKGKTIANPEEKEDNGKLRRDLLLCWGIGPNKVSAYVHLINDIFLVCFSSCFFLFFPVFFLFSLCRCSSLNVFSPSYS